MANQYLAWTNADCKGSNIEWLEMTGREFYAFIKKVENKNRRFIKLSNDICYDDDVIYIEATEAQYQEWYTDNRHARYLRELEKDREVVSLDFPLGGAEKHTLHEIVADESVNVEEDVVEKILLERTSHLLEQLSSEEQELLTAVYAEHKTTVALAKEMGITHQAVSKRIAKLINKLKKDF